MWGCCNGTLAIRTFDSRDEQVSGLKLKEINWNLASSHSLGWPELIRRRKGRKESRGCEERVQRPGLGMLESVWLEAGLWLCTPYVLREWKREEEKPCGISRKRLSDSKSNGGTQPGSSAWNIAPILPFLPHSVYCLLTNPESTQYSHRKLLGIGAEGKKQTSVHWAGFWETRGQETLLATGTIKVLPLPRVTPLQPGCWHLPCRAVEWSLFALSNNLPLR